MNYKPFDLQKALAGDPVISGKDIGYFRFIIQQCSNSGGHKHLFVMTDKSQLETHEYCIMVNDIGDYMHLGGGGDDTLLMAPKPVDYWVATGLCMVDNTVEVGKPFLHEYEARDCLARLSFIDESTIQTHKIIRYE